MSFKKELRTNIDCFINAYHRGRWVSVPVFYVPNDAVGDDGCLHHIQLILVDEQELPKPPRRCINHAYDSITIQETILPWRLSNKELKELCTKNDIPLSWVTGFQREISKNNITDRSSRRKKRKYTCINTTEYKKFIRELRKISCQSVIIAEILWFLNKRLQAGDDYITLEEILRMRIQDVDPEDGLTTCICLSRTSPQGCHMIGHYLPKYIWRPLCRLIRQDSLFVFSNKNHGPHLPSDIAKHFKKAGKLAGIKGSVCSLSLRPIGINCSVKHDVPKKIREVGDDVQLYEISIQEWKTLCRQVPKLIGNRGRPPTHNPRDIFNGILHHRITGTPIRKLPSNFPPAKAIHSQYRRWLKNGVFNLVLAARQ